MYTNSIDSAAPSQGISAPTNYLSAWQCAAYGCPLPGGISEAIGPEAQFWCRFHFQTAPEERDRITHKLRMNLPLAQHLQAMLILSSDAYWLFGNEYQDERQQAYQFADCPKTEGMDHHIYVEALNAMLRRRIYPTLTPPKGVARKTPPAPKLTALVAKLSANLRLP